MRCRDDEKQQNIKKAVIKLILAEGFHGISISKIAREAGISPATVYVYYDNKDAMLRDIYRECGEKIHSYVLGRIDAGRGGPRLVESMVQAYYTCIVENGEEFFFVEQYTSCPALVGKCSGLEGATRLSCLLDDLKRQQVIKDINNQIIAAIMFESVKRIAVNCHQRSDEAGPLLAELTRIIQDALLVE